MFAQCGDCVCAEGPTCFTVARRIGGFAEYIISSTTTNPCTWFVGRRYRTAEFSFSYTAGAYSYECTDPGGTLHVLCAPGIDVSDYCEAIAIICKDDFSASATSQFSALTNIPSHSTTGSGCNSSTLGFQSSGFAADGYYSLYNTTTFGLDQGGDALSYSGDTCGDTLNTWPDSIDLTNDNFGAPCVGSYNFGTWSWTNTISGSAPAASGSISNSSFSGSGGSSCTLTANGSFTSRDGLTHASDTINENTGFSDSDSGTLTNEVNYDAVHDSVTDAVTAIQSGSATTTSGYCNWGFNDYPIETNNFGLSSSSYDGSLFAGQSPDGYWYPPGVLTTRDVCVDNPSAPARCLKCGQVDGLSIPNLCTVALAATWYQIGTTDTPGVDPWDTWIAALSMKVTVSSPYIIVTYIIMNDGSLVLDTYGSGACTDGTVFGTIWIPQPSAKSLPTGLYGTSGGTLVGPIGRVNVIIEGTTCATWSGVTPT